MDKINICLIDKLVIVIFCTVYLVFYIIMTPIFFATV